MKRGEILDVLIAFMLGLAVLNLAVALVQGLIVVPIELRAGDISQSWATLTIHVAGRAFTFLEPLESLAVLAIILAVAVAMRRRTTRAV